MDSSVVVACGHRKENTLAFHGELGKTRPRMQGIRGLGPVLSTTNSVPKEFLATRFEGFSLAFIPKVIATLDGSFSRILFGDSRSDIILDGVLPGQKNPGYGAISRIII